MITISVILFALAAVFGLVILLKILKGQETPKPAVFIHGALAAIALVLLLIFTLNNPTNAPTLSLVLFIVAALGGFVLFAIDLKTKNPPRGLALIHAGAAVVGFLLLLLFVFGS
ncbi:hypothetical protein QQ008_28515 [Fulvivirgaceae bacterium BMA10]|uniref:Uncharacterized protein n=1 Tax=Splendidivirga corallicola TaxID=3051826 RepID=A0ABT8KX77_9BACT|nr:hypothetical protein [Fulvivirgaceae bacterium BMA10]